MPQPSTGPSDFAFDHLFACGRQHFACWEVAAVAKESHDEALDRSHCHRGKMDSIGETMGNAGLAQEMTILVVELNPSGIKHKAAGGCCSLM